MTDAIRAADTARAAYSSARNCAESVLSAIQAEVDLPGVPEATGSGFTTGIGNTGCVCGALAGGVMMLGAYAETEDLAPEARRLRAEALSAEFIERFKERWGATCCRVIKRGQEPASREWATHCAGITEHAAALALEMIEDARGGTARRYGPRDLTAVAQRLALGVLSGGALGLATTLVAALLGVEASWPVVAGAVLGLVVALLAEAGTSRPRFYLRVLKVAGLAAGVVAALVAMTDGQIVSRVLTGLLSAGVAAPIIALALLVLALVRGYEFMRFR